MCPSPRSLYPDECPRRHIANVYINLGTKKNLTVPKNVTPHVLPQSLLGQEWGESGICTHNHGPELMKIPHQGQSHYNLLHSKILEWNYIFLAISCRQPSQVRSSRSWVRSKVKVKTWVQHSVDSSLPFHVNLASHSWVMAFSTFGLQWSRSNGHNIAQLQVQTIPQNFKWYKSIQQFQRYGFRKVWPKCCLIWQVFGPWASPYGANNYDAAQLQV